MTSHKEKYIVSWLYDNGMWSIGCITNTCDEAIKSMNSFKCHDKRCGKEYKYRITKQTIQEEVVYDEL